MRKLPIGIQDFESLISDDYIYVDKTEYIYKLTREGKPYFLSRPRRFGKSLLLSTMRAYFEGKKELFKGLAIEELSKDDKSAFEPCPIFYFDFNKDNFKREDALETVLDGHLKAWEKKYGISDQEDSLSGRFQKLIEIAATDKNNVVVLVDEYDKPLLEADNELLEHNKAVFKGFFSTLKSYDRYLKFVFLTGVTKFSKVSIFSDLNQLQDISMDEEYAGICGITEKELRRTFIPEIEAMAERRKLTVDECLDKLKKMYDGYHFHPDADGVYNPFSLINAFKKKEFGAYWFETGTPTFLVDRLKNVDIDIKEFTDGSLYAEESELKDYRSDNPNPIPLLYQTGYLTIVDYDEELRYYGLSYPNNEVKYGFLKSLVPMVLHREDKARPLDIRSFLLDIRSGEIDSFMNRFVALYANIPYVNDEKETESNFQNVIYIVFMLLGQFAKTEVHNAVGRADVILETQDYIFIFEFKRDKSAKEALDQIEDKGYAKPYAADSRKLYKVGVNFLTDTRTIDEWLVE